ncbi:T9SS type A sorting domain-containing protein [Aquimarina brevivitae]|uniref:Putative secreted protein (Por secretion system target) n=1 Tax=Aquimarina brevivitae TaxID=323412 RepID=A0A4Q7PI37_9FLAO|nr:T9SS type A sorting domain-containing protein [Aquimarina brevivitae]RZS99867.1 putative secreted protein (Por secretion system target) [Aquimarina brevivitae]
MKSYKLLLPFIFFISLIQAQVTNEGKPQSFNLKQKATVDPIKMPEFDLKKIQEEDKINDQDRAKPWRFGYEFSVDYGMKNSGVWDEIPGKGRIWRVLIESKGAKTLNFVFNKYKVPTGATVYLYNDDKTDLLGAYTNVFNRPDEMLGTWMVDGDKVWIEYFEPNAVRGQGNLNLSKVVHGYRSVTNAEVMAKALNSSGDCNQDVDCPVGSDFDAIKDELKRAVGFIILNGFVCSGTLINNTNNDGAPYFLTANHCDEGSHSTWAFRFNWISPNPSCATVANSTDAAVNQTTSGATVLAANSKSDMKLLRLDGGLDESWDLEWAGWDRSDNTPSFVVGIHHPSGDIMKVCRENDAPTKTAISFNGNPSTEMWRIADWDLGVTEGGSSGSAIFDPSGRIVGQLAGGAAACQGTNDNNQFDVYGRFNISWDFGTTDATRLSNWLDPANTGQTTLDRLSQVLSVEDNLLKEGIRLFPNPVEEELTVINSSGNPIQYKVFNLLGQLVNAGKDDLERFPINVANNKSGMYFITIEDMVTKGKISQKIIIK